MKKRTLLTTTLLWLGMLGFGQDSVNITFHVNMNNELVDPTGVYVAGGSGFGVPGDNPMSDPDGDGVWSVTIRRPEFFSSHYTYLNGNCPGWTCKENIAGQPCSDPNNFNDRFISVTTNDTVVTTCFAICSDDTTCALGVDSVDITILLNMKEYMVDPGGVYIAGGGNFGNPGDFPMLDPDGDGVYAITVRRPEGFSSFYTFTNGNCGDFSCKENIAGQPCADPANFNDRFMQVGSSDTTILTCFQECTTDTVCTPLAAPVNITFRVDMSEEAVDSTGVFIGADFDGWGGGLQMLDPDGDMIYEYTAALQPNMDIQWKFINGANWAVQELFDPFSADSVCTVADGEFTNRGFSTGDSDETLDAFCFNSCSACGVTSIGDDLLDQTLFDIRPNRISGSTLLTFADNTKAKQVTIFDLSGRQVMDMEIDRGTEQYKLSVDTMTAGMYFVSVRQGNKVGMKKMIVLD